MRANVVSPTTSHETSAALAITVTASASVSTCVPAYASWEAHASKPVTTTITDTCLLTDKRPLTSALTSPPAPAAVSRTP